MSMKFTWNCGGQNNFNFLRVLFAIAVIFSHSNPLLFGIKHLDPVGTLLHEQHDQQGDHAIDLGHMAVYGFFVLSGFLISMSWHRGPNLGNYLGKRIRRIYPGFLVALLLTVLVFGPLGSPDYSSYFKGLSYHLLGWTANLLNLTENWEQFPFTETLQSVPYPHVLNGSIWTIRYEFLCYLLVAALGFTAQRFAQQVSRRTMRIALAAFFGLVYVLYVGRLYGHFGLWNHLDDHMLTSWLVGQSDNVPRLFVYFVAGMCCYAFRGRIRFTFPWLAVSAVGLVFSSLVPELLPLTLPVFGPYMLLALAFAPWLKLSRFGTKRDLSYGIYLYAFPIQQLLVLYGGTYLNQWTAFLAALPFTLCLAWLSWHFVEQPALRRNKLAAAIEAGQAVASFPCPEVQRISQTAGAPA